MSHKQTDPAQLELTKTRKSEQKWQLECQQLVGRLELEMNRADDFERKFDDESLRCKEFMREIADLRLVLHQTQTGKS